MRPDPEPANVDHRPLTALFAPESVAVVGASEDPRKWGCWLARGALRGEQRRPVYLVNRRASRVLSRRAYAALSELPARPDLVVIAVPGPALEATVDEALAAGARAIVAITAGGDPLRSAPREASMAARVRSAGAVLLGPNCLGVLDSGQRLELVSNPLPAGPIGLISQSGNLALELGLLAAPERLGFSRFASLGNQADLGATELLRAFAEHPPTEVIALYVEDFRDGRAFAAAAADAVAGGKPVLALAIERSDATGRAVRSHTGALASDGAAIDAACRAAGIVRVRTPRQLIDAAQALLRCPRASGRRVAVLSDGGGHATIAAAVAAAAGLSLPELGPQRSESLRAQLPEAAGVSNPIDVAGGAERDVHTFPRIAQELLGAGDADALLITGYFGGYREYGPEVEAEELRAAERLGEVAAATGRPVVVHTMFPRGRAADVLRGRGVAVYETIEQAASALALLATASPPQPGALPAMPAPAPPVGEAGAPADETGYEAARELLAAAGVPFVAQRTVAGLQEALDAAAALGYPIVLKALGTLHKSDSGGVVVGIADAHELRRAYRRVQERLRPPRWSVERMAPVSEGVELLIGARQDARFGTVALAGAGGIHAEVLRDVAVALAPVDRSRARAMLRSLRIAPLLAGVRGRPALAIDAAADALCALSRAAAEHPELAEVEINPLLVTPSAAIALDARFIPATPTRGAREDAVHLHA
ncbi:MAG TPA: acetate--CoA ligase family protein [Solirubrobacteraceae bacterium]|nr:acetate--CoA ligase family protein [Solirubrobacteraceae bacterium]